MTEKEKMLAGKIYDASDSELKRIRESAHRLSREYNLLDETDADARAKILRELLPNAAKSAYLQGPVQFDYGVFTKFGENFYANFNFTVLDCAPVTVGNNVFVGPNCSLVTPVHPLLSRERNGRTRSDGSVFVPEYAKPIVIGDDCWLASNVTVCGGALIGRGSVIAAGSVVTGEIPPNSFAGGVPCRVIRTLTAQDSIELKEDLR
ncbi:MAG: sugar O-acetyltransferase [Treponema sp.]